MMRARYTNEMETMEMKCNDAEKYILDIAAGDGEGVPVSVSEHIEKCSHCREISRLIREARSAVEEAIPVMVPERGYLTDERLKKLLEATEEATSYGARAPIDFERERRRRYRNMRAGFAVAALVMLSMAVLYFFNGVLLPGRTEARDVAGLESDNRQDTFAPQYQILNDFNAGTFTTADMIEGPGSLPVRDGGLSGNLLLTGYQEVSMPIRETSHIRHDDYWW